LRAADALPAQLEAALRVLKVAARVRGAGVSGDTTAGGLARLDFSVQPDTDLCVVELGGNDLLQGVDIGQTRANLDAIVRRLKDAEDHGGVAGGGRRRRLWGAMARLRRPVPAIAAAQHVPWPPDLLAGVMDRPGLKQADGLHPNPAGVKLVAARLARWWRRPWPSTDK